jgi:hypothetical protein
VRFFAHVTFTSFAPTQPAATLTSLRAPKRSSTPGHRALTIGTVAPHAKLRIDPARLAFFWCAERCTQRFDHETRQRNTVKPLRKVRRRGYDVERVLVVDDSPEKHVLNYGNLIHVQPFEGDAGDAELPMVRTYIDSLAAEPNVRKIDKRGWRAVEL